MAHSKQMDDLSLGSDTDKRDLCGACAVDREYRLAKKYCLDCSQPICQLCVDSHRRIKMLQGHKLVDNRNEDAVKIAETLSLCLVCPSHADKKIEFACLDHEAFCCSTCATVNHRGCQITEVVALAQTAPDICPTMKHITEAKAYLDVIIKFRQKNHNELLQQVGQIIPKQIQEMKASVMKAFDELEKHLIKETRSTADSKIAQFSSDIAKLQAYIETVDKGAKSLTVAQQNGTDVHKFIAAKTVERQLAEIDNVICQARGQLKSEHLSFSFDKETLLRNAYVGFNNVNKSLAEVEAQGIQPKQQPSPSPNQMVYPFGAGYVRTTACNPFATFSIVTKQVKTSDYPYGQQRPPGGFFFGTKPRNF